MAVLQKQPVDVRLLGLDEKANPRTAVAGTITDGRNWTIDKEGRITKRPGLSALAMLDTSANALTGRELAALGTELVLSDGKRWYGRNPESGQWMPRGFAAYERLDISPVVATPAACNGVDSALQMDTAEIDNYRLTLMAQIDGTVIPNVASSGWTLTDAVTGQTLLHNAYLPYYSPQLTTDGHTAAPTFVAFGADASNIYGGAWDATSPFQSVTWSAALIADMMTATQWATSTVAGYGITGPGTPYAPYQAVLVADNVWLVAYLRNDGSICVVKVTRTLGTATFSVSAPTVIVAGYTSSSTLSFAWACNVGDATAHLAWFGGLTVRYCTITVSTLANNNYTSQTPSQWANCANRGATGITVAGTPYFFADEISVLTGARSVYMWTPGITANFALLCFRGCGLLSHAFAPTVGDTGEIGLGVSYPSPWQPSAFLMRIRTSGTSIISQSIGAHLQNGNYAGNPITQKLPSMAGGVLALGVLTNPVSIGGPGTVSVTMAALTASTRCSVSPPAEHADGLVIPGAVLKYYDGAHVTEAAFALAPEAPTATESTTTGITYQVDSTGSVLSTNPAPTMASTRSTPTFDVDGIASITLVGPAAGLTAWPSGAVTFSFWAKIVNPTGGVTYTVAHDIGGRPSTIPIKTGRGQTWSNGTPGTFALSTSWQHFTFSIPVVALTTIALENVLVYLCAQGAPNDGAQMMVAFGGSMAPTIATPFPCMTVGQREYFTCAAWSDAAGRVQRSPVSPATIPTSVGGLAVSLSVAMLSITERGNPGNLDAGINPAVIEVYRTKANETTAYRIATATNVINGAPVTITDALADSAIDGNEQLYTFAGAVVANFPPIGCNLVAEHQGRVFVATADGQVFFSAYAQSGEGLAFAAEYQVEVEHIPGKLTALLSLDDKLAICTPTSLAALTGIGPEATGVPAYDSPMVIATGIGPINQRACARTPTGYVVVTQHGAHMMDRGLSLNYIGIQEELDVPDGANWYAAAFHPDRNQVRLYGDSLVTVYDWTVSGPPGRTSQFFKWTYAQTVVASAVVNGVLYVLGANGTVYASDVAFSDAGTAYQEWVQFSIVQPGGVNGWARIYSMRVAGDIATGTTLDLVLTSEEGNLNTTPATDTNSIAGPCKHAIAKPRYGKCSSMLVWMGEHAATTTAGITVDAIGLIVGNKGGAGRLPAAARMARS